MSDEEIIRRRLMIDGDGTGDDRRLNVFLKAFNKWATTEDLSEQDSEAMHERLLLQLSQCEVSLQKSVLGCRMNDTERQHYDQLYEQIHASSQQVQQEINQAKVQLDAARQVRRNRMEYDALARLIQQHPDRKSTEKKLERLTEELESLKKCQLTLDDKLEARRKQFHALITCIHQLQQTLEEDENDGCGGVESTECEVAVLSGECDVSGANDSLMSVTSEV